MNTPHPDHANNPAPPERPSPARPSPDLRCRAGAVVDWVGWHLLELVGIGAPLVGAWLISAWCALLSAGVAVWWAVHELRTTASTVGTGTDHTAAVRAIATPSSGGVDTGEQASDVRGQSA